MKGTNKQRANIIRQMQQLANAKVNDSVKLAYLSQEEMHLIDHLDLTALTEFKRSSNGVVEVKFSDRAKALEQLLQLTQEREESPVEAMMKAMGGTLAEE